MSKSQILNVAYMSFNAICENNFFCESLRIYRIKIACADRSKAVLLLWIFYVFFCLVFAIPLCASVYLCLVVTCWERTDLLAFVCGV